MIWASGVDRDVEQRDVDARRGAPSAISRARMSVEPHIVEYATTSLSLGLLGDVAVVGVEDGGYLVVAPDDTV